MHTLDEIEGKIAAGTTDATAGDVLDGKDFITRTAGSGESMVEGTMVDREGDNASTAQAAAAGVNYLTAPEGYYDGDDRVSATDAEIAALDGDLVAGNVANGVDIFGVTGNLSGGGGLPKTGQTTSYRSNDDGDIESGIARSYTYSDDGTIDTQAENVLTDDVTGLQWIRDHTLVDGTGGVGGDQDISGTMNFHLFCNLFLG